MLCLFVGLVYIKCHRDPCYVCLWDLVYIKCPRDPCYVCSLDMFYKKCYKDPWRLYVANICFIVNATEIQCMSVQEMSGIHYDVCLLSLLCRKCLRNPYDICLDRGRLMKCHGFLFDIYGKIHVNL